MKDAEFTLHEDGVLVKLNIGQAGLSARSSILSAEAAEKHEASADRVAGIVQILKPADRKNLTKAINMARETVRYNTLPWEDGGYRLLPLLRYDTLRNELEDIQELFDEAVADLVSRRDDLAATYKKEVGAVLASEHPFPTKDELSSNFRISLNELPLPDLGKTRLKHLKQAEQEAMRERVMNDINQKLEIGGKEMIERMIKAVDKLRVQCQKTEDTRWHPSIVGNIETLVETLTVMNVTNSPEINRLINRVKDELSSISVQDLKDNEKFRTQTARKAGTILKDLKGYKGSR